MKCGQYAVMVGEKRMRGLICTFDFFNGYLLATGYISDVTCQIVF